MKVVYVAGPYRDKRGEFYVRRNIREAEEVALKIWKNGGVALCPHKNTAGFGGAFGISDETWLQGDFELIRRCDALYVMDGWAKSAGTCQEIECATDSGIPIFYSFSELISFVNGVR